MLNRSDRQTFVMVAQATLLVVLRGPSLFSKAEFQTYAVFSYLLHNTAMLMS